jgi:cytochrome P450
MPLQVSSILALGAVGLLAYAAVSLISHQRHIRKLQAAGIPMPPYHPVFGHLLAIKKIKESLPYNTTFHLVAQRIARQFPGGIFYLTLWPFSKTIIIVSDPHIAAQVEAASLKKPANICETLEVINGGPSLMTMHNGSWKEWRALFSPGFATGHLTKLAPAIAEEAAVFCKILEGRARTGGVFQLEELTLRLTFDIIGRITFGGRLHYQTQPSLLADSLRRQILWTPFVKSLNPVKRYLTIRPLVQRYNSYLMDLYLDREIDQRFEELVQARKDNPAGSHEPGRSIISLALDKYLEHGQEADLSKQAFQQLARPQLRMFLFAGHDTTSSTLLYCYYLLSQYPQVLAKVRAEHDSVFGPVVSPEQYIERIRNNPVQMNQLPYTTAVIKEVLRIFPPAGSIREGETGLILQDKKGYQYPTEDCHIWTLSLVMQNNGENFIHPREFMPERWIVEPGDPLYPQKGSWRPFEWGPRNCIGQTLAQLELKVVLVMTVRFFDIKPSYNEWDILHPREGLKLVDGNRMYQAELGGGGAHPADGFPISISLRV